MTKDSGKEENMDEIIVERNVMTRWETANRTYLDF